MTNKFRVAPRETLEPGDLVRINDDGKVEKAKPGDSRFMGALPPTMKIEKDILIVPEYWYTAAMNAISE